MSGLENVGCPAPGDEVIVGKEVVFIGKGGVVSYFSNEEWQQISQHAFVREISLGEAVNQRRAGII